MYIFGEGAQAQPRPMAAPTEAIGLGWGWGPPPTIKTRELNYDTKAFRRKFHSSIKNWVLVSEPGILKVLAHFLRSLILSPEMKPRNNIVY